jgi:hypothetical protein
VADIRDTIRPLVAELEAYVSERGGEGDHLGFGDATNVRALMREGYHTIIGATPVKPTGFVRLQVLEREVWLSPGAAAVLAEGLGAKPDPSVRLDEADLRRLLDEREHLRRQRDELQNDCSKQEREARIARARAEYWEAAWDKQAAEFDVATSASDKGEERYRARLKEATARQLAALNVLLSYKVTPQGHPLPKEGT